MGRKIHLDPKQRIATIFGLLVVALSSIVGGIIAFNALAAPEDEITIYLIDANIESVDTQQTPAWNATYNINNQDVVLEFSNVNLTTPQQGASRITVDTSGISVNQYIQFSSHQDLTQYEIYLRERDSEFPRQYHTVCFADQTNPGTFKCELNDKNGDNTDVDSIDVVAGKYYDLMISQPQQQHQGPYIVSIAADEFGNDNKTATYTRGNDTRTLVFDSAFTNNGEDTPYYSFENLADVATITFSAPDHPCMSNGDNNDPYRVKLQANRGDWSTDFTCDNHNYSIVLEQGQSLADDNYTIEIYRPDEQGSGDPQTRGNLRIS